MSLSESPTNGDFLRDLTAERRAQVLALSVRRDYPAGSQIFAEGGTNRELHLIESGHVRLEMHVPGRGGVPILSLGPGDVLAWSAVLGSGVMTASAVALEPVRTLAVAGEALTRLCEADHELGYCVMRQLALELCRRLVATRLQLLDLFAGQEPVLPPWMGK